MLQVIIQQCEIIPEHKKYVVDPTFVQFEYGDEVMSSKDSNLNEEHKIKFDTVFQLKNVLSEVRQNNSLSFSLSNQNLSKNGDKIALTTPLTFSKLTASPAMQNFKLELLANHKIIGHLVVDTQYLQKEATSLPQKLNSKCKLALKILSASFLKDSDLISKQDPFIQFKYGNTTQKTVILDEAGQNPVFNSDFLLDNIRERLFNDDDLVFEAYDKDIVSQDNLGSTKPIPFLDFVKESGKEIEHCVDIFKSKKKTGTLKFSTTYIFEELKMQQVQPPRIMEQGFSALYKGVSSKIPCSEFASTMGMKNSVQIKIIQHQNQQIESRILRLSKEDEKAKKRIQDIKRN